MKKKSAAFTLAEVLITLGIIGVVAAITIPTLIQNYNVKQWNTASLVFERKLEEALKIMNSQSSLAGQTTTENFVNELSKHFKISKVCSNDKILDCFSDIVFWGGGDSQPSEVDISDVQKAKHMGQPDWDTNVIGVQFANGTNALIAYNSTETCIQDPLSNQINVQKCLAILFDTSGYKNPNTIGKDLRANENVTSLGKNCAFKVDGTCYSIPFIPTAHTWNACQSNGTSTNPEDLDFMQTYGISTCLRPDFGTEDYWAGAVEICGGVQNMPTMNQLADLANYLYNTSGIGPESEKSNVTLDTNKANELGIKLNGNAAYIWSGKEVSNLGAGNRLFYPTVTKTFGNGRATEGRQAICLIN